MEVLKTGNPDVVKDFLESIALEAVKAHRDSMDKLMVEVVAQGIMQERNRCLDLVDKVVTDAYIKQQLISLINEEALNAQTRISEST